MRPLNPCLRRNGSGRPAVFVASSETPISATARGRNSTSARLGSTAALLGGGTARFLRETTVEDEFGDAVLHDLDRAAGDHPAARAALAIFDQALLGITESAQHLHRLVGRAEARLVAVGLGERGLV